MQNPNVELLLPYRNEATGIEITLREIDEEPDGRQRCIIRSRHPLRVFLRVKIVFRVFKGMSR